MIHSVAVSWEDLLNAFANMEPDKSYFFDRFTGEIFFVSAEQEEGFWDQLENQQNRFLQIPTLDAATERTLVTGFLKQHTDPALSTLLEHALTGRPPYAKPSDILSFFPDEEQQLAELRDTFLSDRVKTWLEENDLFSLSTSLNGIH